MKTKALMSVLTILAVLFTAEAAFGQAVKVGDSAALKIDGNVLEGPTGKAAAAYSVKKEEVVTVAEIKGIWARIVNSENKSGWVPVKSLKPAPKKAEPPPPETPPPAAKIVYKSGEVKVLRADGVEETGEVGMELASEDSVITGASSTANIEAGEGRNLVLGENSKITVGYIRYAAKKTAKNETESKFKIMLGRVFVSIRKGLMPKESFMVEKKTVVAGVRGTEFRITAESEENTRIEVTQSNITVSSGKKSSALKEDFGLRAAEGKPLPKPKRLPPPPEPSAPGEDSALQTFSFSWKSVDAAKAYRFEIASDEGFMKLVTSQIIEGAAFNPESFTLPIGEYYWRVSTIDKEDFEGRSSKGRKFSVTP